MDWQNVREILEQASSIAIIGAKDKAGQPVDRVGRYLMEAGYDVIPVHHTRKNVWGLETCEKLTDIERPVHIVVLFRAAEQCPQHAQEALLLSRLPLLFWMQLGIEHPASASALAGEGVHVVQNACIMVEHARLFGRQILA
ncbi:CoA-binding protein [Desulfovibrio sp. OttesenSCG-928-A18]|nr:CoA-binding protein [Desulfovibrio sp. OttesenSCG-928-A18]